MVGKVFYAAVNGLTPLCFNRRIAAPTTKLSEQAWGEWEEEHWKEKLYKNSEGQLIVPVKALRKTYVEATRFSEMKPPGRMKSWRPFIESCLMIENDMVVEYDEKKLRGWKDYVRRGSGMVPIIRPVVDVPWSGGYRVAVYDANITMKVVDHLSEIAGRVCGWLEARKYVGYGRSEISITELS